MMHEEPTTGELARGLDDIKRTLQGVMTVALFEMYQGGLDQRIANLVQEQNASVIRHNADIQRLERLLEKHAETSAADKKTLQDRQAGLRSGLIYTVVGLLGTFVLGFVRIGGVG